MNCVASFENKLNSDWLLRILTHEYVQTQVCSQTDVQKPDCVLSGAQQFASCQHKIDGKNVQTHLTKTSSFYQDKLFFKNVPRNIPKEMVMQYMEIISGQEGIELVYSDQPGGVLVTFHSKIGKYCKRIVKGISKIVLNVMCIIYILLAN